MVQRVQERIRGPPQLRVSHVAMENLNMVQDNRAVCRFYSDDPRLGHMLEGFKKHSTEARTVNLQD